MALRFTLHPSIQKGDARTFGAKVVDPVLGGIGHLPDVSLAWVHLHRVESRLQT